MNEELSFINEKIYLKLGYNISQLHINKESTEYSACTFLLNDFHILYRTSKITPTKTGQFVTLWKRNLAGTIEPFNENDCIDYVIIQVQKDGKIGQFIFPKSVLIAKGILSTSRKDGKRGFRVYPIWDITTSKQAITTQNWQLKYFYTYSETMDLSIITKLFKESLKH
ncbi:MepB family protein [Nonlabens mediterrranea]|uniref:MepB family protein n=1 Tax=Nonlabens mediterrranea TaxID=1419947 RepID=A0ABS0A0F3_9FLAO|nr:MepB family protein [Nonlabens mediterrranea]